MSIETLLTFGQSSQFLFSTLAEPQNEKVAIAIADPFFENKIGLRFIGPKIDSDFLHFRPKVTDRCYLNWPCPG